MDASEFTSIGRAAVAFGLDVRRFRHVARDLDIEPQLVLNGVPHFTPEQLQRVAARLDELHPITPFASRARGLR